MKRDPYLIRRLLLNLDAGHPDASEPDARYHLFLLQDGGYVADNQLTWQGHDLLELCRDGERFKHAVDQIRSRTGGVSFELLKLLLAKEGTTP